MWIHQPSLGFFEKIVWDTINFPPTGLIVGDRDADFRWCIQSRQFREPANYGIHSSARIKHVVHNQQSVLGCNIFDQIIETVHAYTAQSLVDACTVR